LNKTAGKVAITAIVIGLLAGAFLICKTNLDEQISAIQEQSPIITTASVNNNNRAQENPRKVLIMEATAYCCGNITSTGVTPIAGRTVAVDPRVIPYGSKLIINGQPGYIAEDCGNYWSDERSHTGYYKHIRGNRIDIYMPSRAECMEFGRKEVLVEIIIPEGR